MTHSSYASVAFLELRVAARDCTAAEALQTILVDGQQRCVLAFASCRHYVPVPLPFYIFAPCRMLGLRLG